MNRMRLVYGPALLLWAFVFSFGQSKVAETVHNLSVSGPGEFRSIRETEICIFCHTPHSALPKQPLWNHELSAAAHYKPYRSPTLDAPTQGAAFTDVDGSSKLCLGCHDGTVALGALASGREGEESRGRMGALPPSSRGYLGTDISGSHPVSFVVTPGLIAANNAKDSLLRGLGEMSADPKVKLDKENKVQCTSCHDAHSDENFATSGVHFWAKPMFEEVCIVCHIH